VVIQGDGGLMLSLGELAAAAQCGAPVVVCVFNDHGYGVLRAIEETHFDGRQFGVDLATPDFVALAGAMGIDAAAVDSADAFDAAFSRAVDSGRPWLLEIDMRALSPMRLPRW
jgi:acetolactate synthase-1/2/3 large subunit